MLKTDILFEDTRQLRPYEVECDIVVRWWTGHTDQVGILDQIGGYSLRLDLGEAYAGRAAMERNFKFKLR